MGFSDGILRCRCALSGGSPAFSAGRIAKSELIIALSEQLATFDDSQESQYSGGCDTANELII
jgi:hypothetical protein